MADTRQSLFGPSPEEVAMMQSQQGQQDAMGWAQLPAGRGAVAAGAMAGQALGGIAGRALGGQDPMQAKAQKLQAAQQEAEAQAQSMGIDLASNPKDYYKVAAQTLQKYGLIDEAQNVMNISQNHDLAEREMKYKESSVKASDKFGMSGNIIYNKTTGETNPVEGYVGKNTEKDSPLAIAKKDYEEGKLTKEEYDAQFEFILPEKWFCRARNQNENELLYSWLNMISVSTLFNGFDYITSDKGYSNLSESKINVNPKNYTEITYDQFVKYVLNQEPITEDHSQLIKLLNDAL